MSKLREKLKRGEIALGSHISLNDSTITEIMGAVGFDYLWIDTEHTSISLDCLQNHLVAAKACGVSSVVRVPEVSQVKAKPILEMGPDGIVFPQVNSYELALEAVAACKYPPVGNRGWGPRRAMHFGVDMTAQDYIARANDEILTILQFENIDAYKDLDRILGIDGLDVILLGPCDLAASMGHIGDWHHPDVERVVDDLFIRTHKAGKKIGVSYGLCDKEELYLYQRRGVDMISIAAETDFIVRGSKDLLSTMKEVFIPNTVMK